MGADSVAGRGQESTATAVQPLPQPQFDIWQTTVHLLLAGLLSLALGIAVAVPAYELLYAGRVYPGVSSMGLPLGGLTPTEAAALLMQHAQPIAGPKITLYDADSGQRWLVSPADLGVHLDAETMVRAAYALGRPDGFLDSLQAQAQLLFAGQDVPETWAFDETKSTLYLQLLAEQVNRPPRDATLSMLDLRAEAIPARTGRTVDVAATRALLFAQMSARTGGEVPLVVTETPPGVVDATFAQAQIARFLSGPLTFSLPAEEPDAGEIGPWTLVPADLAQGLILEAVQDLDGVGRWQVRLDPQPVTAFVEAIAEAVHRDPVNARLDFDDAAGTVVELSPSQPGRELDVETAVALALERAGTDQRAMTLPLKVVEAEVSAANAAELGIRELISQGISYFLQRTPGRGERRHRLRRIGHHLGRPDAGGHRRRGVSGIDDGLPGRF